MELLEIKDLFQQANPTRQHPTGDSRHIGRTLAKMMENGAKRTLFAVQIQGGH